MVSILQEAFHHSCHLCCVLAYVFCVTLHVIHCPQGSGASLSLVGEIPRVVY